MSNNDYNLSLLFLKINHNIDCKDVDDFYYIYNIHYVYMKDSICHY